MRQQASDQQKAAARPYGVSQADDPERIQNLRAALRANLEMGCSVVELQTCVDAISGALASREECRVAEPERKRRIATGAADMDADPEGDL